MAMDRDGDDGQVTVVAEPEELTAEWLTGALRAAVGRDDVVVTDVERSPIGTGQMGASYRLRLTYAGEPGDLPPTLVAKLPSPDPDRRVMAAGAYRTELGFYRDLAQTVAVRTPACRFAAISEDGATFVLLLEDLHPARQGDQIVGSSVDEARRAVGNLAGLHGPRWCDPTLLDLPWITAIDAEGAELLGQVLVSAVEVFVERFTGRLDAADGAMLAEIAEAIAPWILARPERFAPVHGDYRMDNLMFFPTGSTGPDDQADGGLAAVDWQTVGVGLPGRDLSYFLETSLDPELRRAHEVELVGHYHRALRSFGVTGYSFDECFDDYRFAALQGPLITVLGAAYGTSTERGDDMFLAMATRSCAAVRDLGTLTLV
jgi:hypothetical protein